MQTTHESTEADGDDAGPAPEIGGTRMLEWLGKLSDLEKAATKAPWRSVRDGLYNDCAVESGSHGHPGPFDNVEHRDCPSCRLIAAARNALPTLLALGRLAVEANGWLRDAEEHAEANGTGRIRKWFASFDALTAQPEEPNTRPLPQSIPTGGEPNR